MKTLILIALVGCASPPATKPGSATFTGTIDGVQPFAVDAIAFNREGRLTLKLTDYAGACDLEEMNNAHKQNSSYVELFLGPYPGALGQVLIGGAAGSGSPAVDFTSRDATCANNSLGASSGTVTITTLTSIEVGGTFDLSFSTDHGADHVTGTFDAAVCGDGALVGSGGACVP